MDLLYNICTKFFFVINFESFMLILVMCVISIASSSSPVLKFRISMTNMEIYVLLSNSMKVLLASYIVVPTKFHSCYHSSVHHSKTLLLKQIFHMFLRFPTCVLREIVMFSRTKQLGFLTSKNKHMNANGKNCALTYNMFSLFGSYHYIYFICGILSFHCLELILLLFVQVLETADTLGEVTESVDYYVDGCTILAGNLFCR